MNKPISISAKCITYGRVSHLEELIESFLRQEYKGLKELLIVNDYPLQTLYFDHPEVRIINCKETFKTIGDKENFAVENCKYDTIAVFDDDDSCLPNHLENINKYFPGNDLLHWSTAIAMVEYKIAAVAGVGNSGIVYTKGIWEKVGKHRLENAGYDMSFVVAIQQYGGKIIYAEFPKEEASWIYNWGNGSYHMSGLGRDDPDDLERENVLVRHARHIEKLRRSKHIPEGDIELKPHWNHDYSQMLKDYCDEN
jgi:glycosyltransferase involved in cell wall biosynthesis